MLSLVSFIKGTLILSYSKNLKVRIVKFQHI